MYLILETGRKHIRCYTNFAAAVRLTLLPPNAHTKNMTESRLGNKAPNGKYLNPFPGSLEKFERGDHSFRKERNILLFGASGSGKSSIVNMLLPTGPQAIVSDSASKPTLFEAHSYPVHIKDSDFSIFDLTGLSEKQSHSSLQAAKTTLQTFLTKFSSDGMRLHLLVQCIRAPRVTDLSEKNYQLIYKNICRENVPIVTIITGLEDCVPTMEDWWTKNQDDFTSYGMRFEDHACITATRGNKLPDGGGFRYEGEYKESVQVVHNLLLETASSDQKGWSFEPGRFDHLWYEVTSYLNEHVFGIGKTVRATSTAVADKTQVIQQMAWRLLLEKLWTLLKNCATSWFTKSTKSMDNVPWAGVSELVIYGLSQESFEAAHTALRSHLQDETSSRLQVASFNIRQGDTQEPCDLPYIEVVLKPGLFAEPSPDDLDAVRRHLSTFCGDATGLKSVSVILAA
ncbi:hypothetical protein D9757_010797 [Collybiopsis confluens]|uniref:G domain-containing protein n=1 Tax=Collybiopsis confluens TaxID=2823264 RepID=A0A8H5GTS7_9AGAR|nr:hypothetical protein D9757_010797 [Collybiopsis confluens]